MERNHQMTADILEHLATREPAKTEAQQRLQKKRMQQVRQIELNDAAMNHSAAIEHRENTRRAWSVHNKKKAVK